MPLPTSPLLYPNQALVDTWGLGSRGVRDGSHPVEVYRVDEATWEGKWLCYWEHRHSVIEWLLGAAALWNDSGTTRLSRLLPRHALDKPRLIVTQVTNVRGFKFTADYTPPPVSPPPPPYVPAGGDVRPPSPEYDRAEITALMEFATFPVLEDEDVTSEIERFVSYPETTEPAGEFLQLPGTANLFYHAIPGSPQAGSAIDNKSIPGAQYAKVIPSETFSARFHMLPEDAWEPGSKLWDRVYGQSEDDPTEVPYMGCINKAEIFGRPIGTVLFTRPRPRRRINPRADGFWWDIDFEFAFKPSGWNWIWGWAAAKSGWYWIGPAGAPIDTADTVADWTSLYNARDLRDLFSVS